LSWVQVFLLRFSTSVIFCCLFIFNGNAVAQQIIVNDTTYHFEYMVSKSSTTNPILLNYLNYYSLKTNIGDPYFKYSIAVNLSTAKLSAGQFQVHCTVLKDSILGNVDYLGFDLGSVLYPDNVSIVIEIRKEGKNQKFPIQSPIKYRQTNLESILITDTTTAVIKPHIASIDHLFGSLWKDNISAQMQAIEIYYASDSLISNWDSLVRKINLEKTEMIPLLDYELDELVSEILKYNNLNIVSRLDLSRNDAKRIGQKITNLNIKAAQKQVLLNDYLMNIDTRFILDARKCKDQGNILQSIYLYNKAIEYHRFNIVALHELAKLYYEIGNLEASALLVKQIFTTTYPDDYQYKKCRDIGDLLYRKIVNQGNDMLVAQNFSEAIRIFEQANIFCDSISEPICDGSHQTGIINAKTGIYRSYLSVVEKAIKGNQLSIAQNYSSEAHKYQQSNIKELPNDDDLQKFVDIIVSKQVATSSRLIQLKQYIKALNSLESADSIGRKFRPDFKLQVLSEYRSKAANGALVELTDEVNKAVQLKDLYAAQKGYDKALDFNQRYRAFITDTTSLYHALKGIKTLDYQNLVNDGDMLYRLDLFQNALGKYVEAKNLEIKYQIAPVKNLDSTIGGMSKPLILEYLSLSRQKIWGNDFTTAEQYYQKAETMARSSLLMNDSIVRKDLASTKETYNDQRCRYRTNKYSDFFDKFNSLKSQRRYNEASQYIDSMLVIANPDDFCIIQRRFNESDAVFVKTASIYQQKIQDSRYLGSINNTGDALQNYYTADSIYSHHQLDSNLVKREPIATIFIFVTADSAYIKACEWLYLHNKPEDSGAILALMKQKGVQPKSTKRWQKLFEAALKERALKNKANPAK